MLADLSSIAIEELLIFSSIGFLIIGLDDVIIDLIWLGRGAWRRLFLFRRYARATMETLDGPRCPGRLAIFIGAWAESDVIGPMLRAALDRIDHDDYRIYVGTYANDPATVRAVSAVADPRIRQVIGLVDGPTTKGECLNRVWQALVEDEARDNILYKAVVIHDAEDVIHRAELRLFDAMIERFDLVQLPVLPLVNPASPWVAGHYCDEFAEAHGRHLVVREALGAGLPLAGVGCAISRHAMDRMAAAGAGKPFDETSLTEDYEIGIRLKDQGLGGIFMSIPARPGGPPVAVRAHFPADFRSAVRQKARWMVGIALAGWDRLGWNGSWAECWMRLRDRKALLAAVLLAVAYLAAGLWLLRAAVGWLTGTPPMQMDPMLIPLLQANLGLLVWRVAMRFLSVSRFYGPREGAMAALRIIPANVIALAAAARALVQYVRLVRGGRLSWDKTSHAFPTSLPVE